MTRPRLLDLFCGAGGAAMGYHRAGFDVTGVDNRPQPRYPFEFHQADAMTFPLDGYDAIHASPPCQGYSRALRPLVKRDYPHLIGDVLSRVKAVGVPYVVENVIGAPLPSQTTLEGEHGVMLCGTMFRLPLKHHRLFQLSYPAFPPRGCRHDEQPLMNPVRRGSWYDQQFDRSEREYRQAKGVPWMNREEGREAIPPTYTEHIGAALLQHLKERAA